MKAKRARRVKPEGRLIPESELTSCEALKREAARLIAEGKMPSLAELLRAMREVKKELTVPRTEMVQ